MLYAKAAESEDELKRARVIRRELLTPGMVMPGCSVDLFNESENKVEKMVFLGPWDVDEEKNIFAYNTPLGRNFLNKKENDRVSANLSERECSYVIKNIEIIVK